RRRRLPPPRTPPPRRGRRTWWRPPPSPRPPPRPEPARRRRAPPPASRQLLPRTRQQPLALVLPWIGQHLAEQHPEHATELGPLAEADLDQVVPVDGEVTDPVRA